jgi:AAA+ ATPase superfamily predicted ATPase
MTFVDLLLRAHMNFIGRKLELATLKRFLKKNTASLLLSRSRRHIGKSRLMIEDFARPYKYYEFSGIALTDRTTAQSQRDEFSSQLSKKDFFKTTQRDVLSASSNTRKWN